MPKTLEQLVVVLLAAGIGANAAFIWVYALFRWYSRTMRNGRRIG